MTSENQVVFAVDAVLFDMDGTLTDSIAAVEAAWGKVARDLGLDPEYVIAATHGKRAVDNLAHFKPHIKDHEMEAEVELFEQTILDYADAFHKHNSTTTYLNNVTDRLRVPVLASSNQTSPSSTPSLTPASSASSSRRESLIVPGSDVGRRPSLAAMLRTLSDIHEGPDGSLLLPSPIDLKEEHGSDNNISNITGEEQVSALKHDLDEAWKIEATSVDRSVRILPGVRKMIDSIPEGRYAVATSGARTYAYGAMKRVGIVPPKITITADDKRLKAGKPHPDPFLLAAECLGYEAKRCLVFEDSPSGIRAGVASGATVIALCTSHERSKIENCGAHFIVDNMEQVSCKVVGDSLEFTVTPTTADKSDYIIY